MKSRGGIGRKTKKENVVRGNTFKDSKAPDTTNKWETPRTFTKKKSEGNVTVPKRKGKKEGKLLLDGI